MSDLELDVADLERLIGLAERDCSRRVLTAELRSVKAELDRWRETQQAATAATASTDPPSGGEDLETDDDPLDEPLVPPPSEYGPMASAATAGTEYVTRNKYSWWQDDKTVAMIFDFDGPSEGTLDDSAVQVGFEPRSVDICMHGLGKSGDVNYRYAVHNLCFKIDPNNSSFKVKKNGTRLQVKLRKAERGKEWSGIDDVEERRKRRHKRLADSGASTQELLNNMFQDADDQTRQSLIDAMGKGQKVREEKAKTGDGQ